MSVVVACLTFPSHEEFLLWQDAELAMLSKHQSALVGMVGRFYIYEDHQELGQIIQRMGEALKRDLTERTQTTKEPIQ